MIVVLLRWWYTTGWVQAVHRIGLAISRIEHTLSVPILLKTLFAPWRRIISVGGKSIDQQIRAVFDNVISRCIGAAIRFTVLLCAAIAILGCLIGGVIVAVLWPLLPIAVILFACRSIIG